MEALIFLSKSCAILSIFYTVYYLFFRKETLFTEKRVFFLVGIIAAFALPFLQFTKTVYLENPVLPLLDIQNTEAILVNIGEATVSDSGFDFWSTAGIIYGLGIVVFIILFIFKFVSLHKLLTKYSAKKDGDFLLIETNEKISPFSFFNYIVFNPTLHNQAELSVIIRHEKIHASQWHSADLILANLLCAIQWINPIAWLYKRSLEENLEFIADHDTVVQLTSTRDYQLTLLKNAFPSAIPTLTNQFHKSFIKRRITMLNKKTTQRRNIWKLGLVLPILFLFIMSCSVKEETQYLSPEHLLDQVQEQFIINHSTTDQELDLIEAYFELDNINVDINIVNRKRDNNNFLVGFDFMTKFPGEDRFYRRFTSKPSLPRREFEMLLSYSDGGIDLRHVGETYELRIVKDNVEITDL